MCAREKEEDSRRQVRDRWRERDLDRKRELCATEKEKKDKEREVRYMERMKDK